MTRRQFLACAAAGFALCAAPRASGGTDGTARRPNIVILFADDMGWGDPRCFNPDSAIPTPHMDRLAAEGRRFTDAHSPGAVCTPSRYGLLTGRNYWRLGPGQPGLNGYSANILSPAQPTVATMLRGRGYRTACIGKWHLGMGTEEPVDYSKPLRPGPLDFGFDSYFGIPASLDMAPYLFIEGDRAVDQPTEFIEGTPHGSPGFYREGPIAPGFEMDEVLPRLTRGAVDVIDGHAGEEGTPLFLYVAFNAPHTPWVPVERAQGTSQAGVYGDFVWQVDEAIGTITAALARNGMLDDTLLIVASDNGGLQSWLPEGIEHRCNGPWRGQKGDAWEGGHRIPFIARWPGRIPAGTTCSDLLSLTDLLATFDALTGDGDAPVTAEDSVNQLPALLGTGPGARETLLLQSVRGLRTVRRGPWKLIDGLGGGGLRWRAEDHAPAPGGPEGELFHLGDDPGETVNRWTDAPDRVQALRALLDQWPA